MRLVGTLLRFPFLECRRIGVVKRKRQDAAMGALPLLLFVSYFSIVAVDLDSGLGLVNGLLRA